jgi:hypothetical protein
MNRHDRRREHAQRRKTQEPVTPLFVFIRRRNIEFEAGFILAGQMIVDIPKSEKPTEHQQQVIAKVIRRLTDDAQSGRMPEDAILYGWPASEASRPANAIDIDDDAVMANWAKDRVVIGVRVDPRNDGYLRIDSDQLRQMGLAGNGHDH